MIRSVSRWSLRVVGGLFIAIGLVWILQGLGVLPGSFMTGQIFWSWAGLVSLLLGVLAIYLANRLWPGRPPDAA